MTIEILYIKSYNANKTISAKQIRCKIFISGRVCKLLEISSLFWDGLVFLFSKEEVVVRTSGARPIARAPAFSPHTFFTRSKQSQESVWIEGRRARDLAARDVRTTKKGLKFCKICIPILVRIFCCDLIATGQGLMNSNS